MKKIKFITVINLLAFAIAFQISSCKKEEQNNNQNISLSLNRWKLSTPYSDGTIDYNIQDFISNWSIGYN